MLNQLRLIDTSKLVPLSQRFYELEKRQVQIVNQSDVKMKIQHQISESNSKFQRLKKMKEIMKNSINNVQDQMSVE